MATQAEIKVLNANFLDSLNTPGLEKKAVDTATSFTRKKMREDGFYRKILPSQQLSNDELHPLVDTDLPARVEEMEPDSPAAVSLPFNALPDNIYIFGPRYRVLFHRIISPKFTKDVDALRTYSMDIRQVLSDNSIKDMLAQEDSVFLGAVNTALVGANTLVPATNTIQWKQFSGGMSRTNVVSSLQIMPSTPSSFMSKSALINQVSIMEFMKWGRDEMGGDFSQDLIKNGWAETEFLGVTWYITIKRDLVPDRTIHYFADPKCVGKAYLLEDATMYVKREAFMLEFFSYETLGGAIANVAGLAKAEFV